MSKTIKKMKKEHVKPRILTNALLCTVSKIYLFFCYNVHFHRKDLRQQKRGCLLIYNHYSNKDHYLLAAASNYRRINFVLSGYFYFNKILARILTWGRAIKKEQFKPDLLAIRKMKKVLEQNGIVAIAPAGQVSIDGAPIFVSPAIVKLIRMCKTDVMALRMQGTHLSFPKWRLGKRRCRMDLTFQQVIKAEQIDDYSDEELYRLVTDSIRVNEYDDQLLRPRLIKGHNIMDGLENILIKCPKCGSYYQNEVHDCRMRCSNCGNEVIMDHYGFLKPASDKDLCFSDESKWYEYQRQELNRELENPDFVFQTKVKLLRNVHNERELEEVGYGIITLTNNRLYYEGEYFDEHLVKDFKYDQLVQLPFAVAPLYKVHFEVPDGEGTFMFIPVEEERRSVIRWVQYIDIINEKRLKR